MDTSTSNAWYTRLHWQILIAMLVGTLVGLLGGPKTVDWFAWLGVLFIRLLKMIIVPLVMTSIVTGIASVGTGKSLGRLFGKTLGYYVLSSALAAVAGLILVNALKPGVGSNIAGVEQTGIQEVSTPSSPAELLIDIVPENVIAAAAAPDMLALIFFSIVFGISISTLPAKPRTLLIDLFEAGFQAMMRLTSGVIRFAPIGVFGLIVRVVGASGLDSFRPLAKYMATIAIGLTFHLLVSLPLLLIVLGRIKPSVHFRNMREAMAMAFSTSSSAATLPVTLDAVENKMGVSNRISSFVLPMGATVNMDGTALYECAGVLFIAQVLGIDLSMWQQFLVVTTALLASIGAAAVPSAGLVIIFIVLESVNLRGPEVDLIVGAMLAVDRPLDMFRTAVNVFSDSCGAAIIARSEGEDQVDT